jgi:dTDP-4-dehydrorhamnose 3,5-epimerase
METYTRDAFEEAGLAAQFIQDNQSKSAKGVLRGLHYQINPHPMGKLVRVLRGKVFDVGVDIRKGSPTFGKHFAETLSEENRKMIYFPAGIAHGFLSLEEGSEVLYKCTGSYNKDSERGILWNDPGIGIPWPIKEVGQVILSDKDKKNPVLKSAETNFTF